MVAAAKFGTALSCSISSSKSSGARSDKLMNRTANYLKSLVGAPGFEPGASCAQGKSRKAK
jgi:hypothetical protein